MARKGAEVLTSRTAFGMTELFVIAKRLFLPVGYVD